METNTFNSLNTFSVDENEEYFDDNEDQHLVDPLSESKEQKHGSQLQHPHGRSFEQSYTGTTASPSIEDFYEEDQQTSTLYFKNANFESQEMKKLLSLSEPDPKIPPGLDNIEYKAANVFPDWVLTNSSWVRPDDYDPTNAISEILKVPANKRSQEQSTTLIHWLMSVWKIASTMGFKRCAGMFKEFKYQSYEPGETIITEGERGLKFYIIISGTTEVHKNEIGIVGHLGKGKSFGEIALTQGKDLRTATIVALTKVETLSLHKLDYEYFVRDIQESERRENVHLLQECKLFKAWTRAKIDKMSNACRRKTFEPNQYIFRQGDKPDDLFVILDGSVNIIKEVFIVSKNRWPISQTAYAERTRKVNKPLILNTLHKNDFFGEMSILKNQTRSTSAQAVTRTVLVTLDRLEFLHLISYGTTSAMAATGEANSLKHSEIQNKYIADKDILETVARVAGGPSTVAIIGDKLIKKPGQVTNKFKQELMQKIAAKRDLATMNIDRRKIREDSAAAAAAGGVGAREEPNGNRAQLNRQTTGRFIGRERADALNEHMLKVAKGNSMAEHLQRLSKEAKESEQTKKERIDNILSTPKTVVSKIKRDRSRLETPKSSSIKFGAGGGTPMRAQRRGSLNIDNDVDFTYDGKFIMRRNSSFQVDELLDHVGRAIRPVGGGAGGFGAAGSHSGSYDFTAGGIGYFPGGGGYTSSETHPQRRGSKLFNLRPGAPATGFFGGQHAQLLDELALRANTEHRPRAVPLSEADSSALMGALSHDIHDQMHYHNQQRQHQQQQQQPRGKHSRPSLTNTGTYSTGLNFSNTHTHTGTSSSATGTAAAAGVYDSYSDIAGTGAGYQHQGAVSTRPFEFPTRLGSSEGKILDGGGKRSIITFSKSGSRPSTSDGPLSTAGSTTAGGRGLAGGGVGILGGIAAKSGSRPSTSSGIGTSAGSGLGFGVGGGGSIITGAVGGSVGGSELSPGTPKHRMSVSAGAMKPNGINSSGLLVDTSRVPLNSRRASLMLLSPMQKAQAQGQGLGDMRPYSAHSPSTAAGEGVGKRKGTHLYQPVPSSIDLLLRPATSPTAASLGMAARQAGVMEAAGMIHVGPGSGAAENGVGIGAVRSYSSNNARSRHRSGSGIRIGSAGGSGGGRNMSSIDRLKVQIGLE